MWRPDIDGQNPFIKNPVSLHVLYGLLTNEQIASWICLDPERLKHLHEDTNYIAKLTTMDPESCWMTHACMARLWSWDTYGVLAKHTDLGDETCIEEAIYDVLQVSQ